MSSLFLNRRSVLEWREMLPQSMTRPTMPSSSELQAEQVVFDKAEEAGQRVKARHTLKEQRNKLEAEIEAADGEGSATLTIALDQIKAQMAELETETPPD